ncbi:MAG: alcohol dehydrogenase catalytic domain-containing protein [Lentisphaerae bacterium]|nr:alcohol dehydrogenase catalytic domain-containing protein [Lentisphaerota bacterium]MCP4101126.1 alcohol dehydrogenase catalytic domain-containing protein [Lentisphaerota bacterium]
MRAMRLTGIRQIEMQEVSKPQIIEDDDVLIKMKVVGLCGSDVHYYSNGNIGCQVVEYPFTVGHEGAGIVEAIGAAVTRVKPGDRIAIEPGTPCHECDQCKQGREHTCRHLTYLGCPGQQEGCLSEYLVMKEGSCFPIPDTMTLDEAAISEPLSIGLYGVKLSIPMRGARIAILGCGPIGLSVLLPALAMGVEKVYVSDKIDNRLELAKQAGAHWIGNPLKQDIVADICNEEPLLLDAVFECCGQQDAANQALKLLKPGGKLMYIGIPEDPHITFSMDDMRRREICIQNVRRQNHCVQPALDMIANKEFDVNIMATHRFPLEKCAEAFDLVDNYRDGVVKAMIDI